MHACMHAVDCVTHAVYPRTGIQAVQARVQYPCSIQAMQARVQYGHAGAGMLYAVPLMHAQACMRSAHCSTCTCGCHTASHTHSGAHHPSDHWCPAAQYHPPPPTVPTSPTLVPLAQAPHPPMVQQGPYPPTVQGSYPVELLTTRSDNLLNPRISCIGLAWKESSWIG